MKLGTQPSKNKGVHPTKQLKSEIPINDDEGLEKEADEMGEKALEVGDDSDSENTNLSGQKSNDISGDEVQLKAKDNNSINAIQKVADRSNNVKQLNKLDTLANKRDRDGIRQLQKNLSIQRIIKQKRPLYQVAQTLVVKRNLKVKRMKFNYVQIF